MDILSRARLAGAVVALAMVAVFLWWAPHRPAAPRATPTAQLPTSAPRPAAPGPAAPADAATLPAARPGPAQHPAPSAESSASTGFAADSRRWQAALAAGDLAAGRAWLDAIAACEWRQAMDAAIERGQRAASNSPAASGKDLPIDAERSRYCADTPISPALRFDALLRLALAGELRAQLEFALDPPLQRRRAIAEIELIERYRDHAPAVLRRAVEQGSVQALVALLEAHVPPLQRPQSGITVHFSSSRKPDPTRDDPLGYLRGFSYLRVEHHAPHWQVLEPNPVEAYRLALVCQSVCGNRIQLANEALAILDPVLSPIEQLAARRDADRMRLAYFAHPASDVPIAPGRWWRTN